MTKEERETFLASLVACDHCGAEWVVFYGGEDAGLVHYPWCAPRDSNPQPSA